MAKDILLYMSDQHSYRLQGYAGDPIVRTPNLDRLAAVRTQLPILSGRRTDLYEIGER